MSEGNGGWPGGNGAYFTIPEKHWPGFRESNIRHLISLRKQTVRSSFIQVLAVTI